MSRRKGIILRSYSYLMSDSGAAGGHYVELLESKLHEVLQFLLVQVNVDERWYLSAYGDVADAVRAGELKSAKEHYIKAGFFENRLPRPVTVDEQWYIEEYPDVADAVRAGAFTSARQHFEANGFREGRLPHRGWSLLGGELVREMA